MRRRSHGGGRRNAAAAGLAAVLALAGCSGTEAPPDDPLQRAPGQVHLYGTDGNMLNAIGDLLTPFQPGALAGMKGTTPLTLLTEGFKSRIRSVDSSLVDYSYAGETYDAVVISALAAQAAGSTKSRDIAAQINGVTTGGTECDSFAGCIQLVKNGRDIAYRGITLGLGGFTAQGEPSAGTYGILRFGSNNRIADNLTQFVPTGTSTDTGGDSPRPASSNTGGQLRIGALLPHTGELAEAGPPMFAAGELAIEEINANGGVLGQPVRWLDGDDGTNPEVAKASAQRLIGEGAQVLIGAGASSISLAVLPVVKAAGVVLFSPANTSAQLTTADDGGLYFRTAPPDGLQAAALADVILRDGVRRVAVIYRDEAYGSGLANSTKQLLMAAGLSDDDVSLYPDPAETFPLDADGQVDLTKMVDEQVFGETAAKVAGFGPDGVLIVGFTETVAIVDALAKAGITSIGG